MQLGASTVTRQGQVSIPARVRKQYGLLPGTRFIWEDQDGHLSIKPIRYTLDDFVRLLPEPAGGEPVGVEDAITSLLLEKHSVRT